MRRGTSRAATRRSPAISSGSASAWDEGPLLPERALRAAPRGGAPDRGAGPEGALRFGQPTLLRADGTPTYQLASAVDDLDFEITHVIRGSDHRANAELQAALIAALGGSRPSTSITACCSARTARSSRSGTAPRRWPTCARPGYPPRPSARTWRSSACRGTTCTSISPGSGGLSIEALGGARATRSSRQAWASRSRSRRCSRRARSARGARVRRARARAGAGAVDAPETLARFRELVEGGLDARERSCGS